MESLKNASSELSELVDAGWAKLDVGSKQTEAAEIEGRVNQPDYWTTTDNKQAQAESKKLADLQSIIEPWIALRSSLNDVTELVELGDDSMQDDLKQNLDELRAQYDTLRNDLKFSGPHDASDLVLTIQAGAGGVDAQDWAGLLLRMYTRWAQKKGMTVTTLSESFGEEAGVKSVSLAIKGKFAYGLLKGEHGVHRLVRLSPFNSAGSRETSFVMVEVVPEIDSPDEIEIEESDLRVDVYRAGGHGGQSVNTTDSAVRITHLPTNTVVSIQNERSQLQNKETALKVLKSKLMQLAEEQHLEKLSELRGPNQEAAWGNQIRSYVMQPYTMVKDLRSKYTTSNVQSVLDGDLDELIDANL